tara:strand:+ start:282 stop:737 length:456 start_codon:yes stop_codon:yes gene_type:complete
MSKRQIIAKTTYDAGKLARHMPKIIKGLMKRYAIKTSKDAKDNIDSILSPPLKETTLKIREKRGITGNKPLYATGKLYNSIKVKEHKTTASVSMFKYGALHHKGFNTAPNSMIPRKKVPKRPFIHAKKGTFDKLMKDFSSNIKKSFRKYKK